MLTTRAKWSEGFPWAADTCTSSSQGGPVWYSGGSMVGMEREVSVYHQHLYIGLYWALSCVCLIGSLTPKPQL